MYFTKITGLSAIALITSITTAGALTLEEVKEQGVGFHTELSRLGA